MIFAMLISMKPLHKPIHPKFIYNSAWVKMSPEERMQALSEGKIRIPTQAEFRSLKAAEISELRAKARPYVEEIREDIQKTLKLFPRTLLLVFR